MELYLKNSRKKVYLCERFLIKNFTEKVVHIMMTDFNCQRQFFQQISKIKWRCTAIKFALKKYSTKLREHICVSLSHAQADSRQGFSE